MGKTLLKVCIWIPAIAMAFVMFGFSGQNGDTSGGLSRKVAIVMINTADNLGIVDVDDSNMEQYIENMQFPIRKAAHMTEYAVFSIFIAIALLVDGISLRKVKYIAFIIAVLFACSDEIHQLFVPDRSGKFTDVLIDSIGITVGVLVFYLIASKRKAVDETKVL